MARGATARTRSSSRGCRSSWASSTRTGTSTRCRRQLQMSSAPPPKQVCVTDEPLPIKKPSMLHRDQAAASSCHCFAFCRWQFLLKIHRPSALCLPARREAGIGPAEQVRSCHMPVRAQWSVALISHPASPPCCLQHCSTAVPGGETGPKPAMERRSGAAEGEGSPSIPSLHRPDA